MIYKKNDTHLLNQAQELVAKAIRDKKTEVSFRTSESGSLVIWSFYNSRGFKINMKGDIVTLEIPSKFFQQSKKKSVSSSVAKNLLISSSIALIAIPTCWISVSLMSNDLTKAGALLFCMIGTLWLIKKFCK